MSFMPESPNYLVARSKPDKAARSLSRLRGSKYNVQREVDHLQGFVDKSQLNKWVSSHFSVVFSSSKKTTHFYISKYLINTYFIDFTLFFFNDKRKTSFAETLKLLFSPAVLKPFTILVIYFMLYQFSGVNTVTFYAVEVFQLSGAKWDSNKLAICMGILRLVFTIVGCIAMRRCGRRPLTFVSSECEFNRPIQKNL